MKKYMLVENPVETAKSYWKGKFKTNKDKQIWLNKLKSRFPNLIGSSQLKNIKRKDTSANPQ